MLRFLPFIALISSSLAFASQITILHYNIKELTTDKIIQKNEQVRSAVAVMNQFRPNIVSINEMQFDRKDVPQKGLPGGGRNLERLFQVADKHYQNGWSFYLHPANTGFRAKRMSDGNYAVDPNSKEARDLADTLNFGIFPGQYSVGLASRLPVLGSQVFDKKPLWKEWNPAIDLKKFQRSESDTRALPPSIELFDKNFNDISINVGTKVVHVIGFHTVPSYHFGNPRSPNFERNADQLRFLKWYLTGKCEPSSSSPVRACKTEIRPLASGSLFVGVGDLNVDLRSTHPGARVLAQIYSHPRVQNWQPQMRDPAFRKAADGKSYITYLSDGTDLDKFQAQLDYFVISGGLKIVRGEVLSPRSDYVDHKICSPDQASLRSDIARIEKQFPKKNVHASKRGQEFCVISVSHQFAEFRKGSDHLPMVVTLQL